MAGFELETIEPDAARGRLGAVSGKELEALRDEMYANGYKDGVAAACAGIEAEKNKYLVALNEAVQDQRFEFDQARAAVQASVAAYVAAIADVLAPSLAQAHFEERVASVVQAVTCKALDGGLVLRVAPECHETVGKELDAAGTQVSLSSDEGLHGMVVELDWAGGTDRLDLEDALNVIRAATSDYVAAINEGRDERRRRAG